MIDNDIIKKTIDHAKSSISEQKWLIPDILSTVQNVLHPDLRIKLNHFIEFSQCKWAPEIQQEHLPRVKINWEPESVIEEVHESMMALTPMLNEIFYSDSPLHFWGVSIWKDTEGYYMFEHKDNTDLYLVMQVYLDSKGLCPGTAFYHGESKIDISHRPNTGYMYCNGQERLTHNISYPVPHGTTRYSLYVQWSLLPKYFPNTPQ